MHLIHNSPVSDTNSVTGTRTKWWEIMWNFMVNETYIDLARLEVVMLCDLKNTTSSLIAEVFLL